MYLTGATIESLEKVLGISINNLTMKEEYDIVKTKMECNLHYSKALDNRIRGHSKPLISHRCIYTKQDINKWITGLKYID